MSEIKTATITPETEAPPKTPGAAALVAIGDRGIMLRSLDDLMRFARVAVEGGAAPRGMNTGAAAIAIQAGLERGLGPLGGLQSIVVINGLATWRGQAAAALIRNSGVCRPGTLDFNHAGEGEKQIGWASAHRVGYAQPRRIEFTVADAQKARLWGKEGPWQTMPGRMLMWRALGLLARDLFSDVLGGFPLAEEAEDFDNRPATPTAEERQARAALPPPSAPDPLMAALDVGVVTAAKEPEPETPFQSHAEADAAIAAAEGQGALFEDSK